ncbi:hypothetical protein [Lacipirellula parvula]|uniref:Uncharacterized protein n=1 Tax=Lacipirellula parvula TaxID=2650471 RepID=A0A5K7XA99_9BACT|nr:hypothetical protein [Lacipirellula parvula]BBO33634.1 hypothetical protein PLANPX_3246 [Lacipirellula parvula]
MPRPRFTLRLALALVAIAAFPLWQLSIVRQRREAMSSGPAFIAAIESPNLLGKASPSVNTFRELLGDKPIRYVYIPLEGDWKTKKAMVQRLFPEAEVFEGLPEPEIP